MKFSESLKKSEDFSNVYANGRSRANRWLVMYVFPNMTDRNRIGISVSKKVGNSVIRHRITRLIRESYRMSEEEFKIGYDFVVIARVRARGMTYQDIRSALLCLAKEHGMLKEALTEV